MRPPRWLYDRCRLPLWLKAARLIGAYAALVAASVVLVGVWRSVPGGDNPFIALALHHPMGAFTREKLIDIQEVPELCQETLARSALEYRAIPDRREGGESPREGARQEPRADAAHRQTGHVAPRRVDLILGFQQVDDLSDQLCRGVELVGRAQVRPTASTGCLGREQKRGEALALCRIDQAIDV